MLLAGAAEAPDALAALERRHGGRLGVFACEPGSNRTLAHRADERFLLCSTVKFPLAADVLARVAAGTLSLADFIPFTARDLKDIGYPDSHCPVTAAHAAQGGLTLASLCEAAVSQSDNLAANLLFARIGGPPALTQFLRSLGDTTTRSDRIELALNHHAGDWDTTTPRAITETAAKLLLGDTLPRDLRALLESWLQDCQTGLQRLRRFAPPDWRPADKTGTGNDEANDIALFRRPNRPPFLVTALYNALDATDETRESVLAEAGRIVFAWAAWPS